MDYDFHVIAFFFKHYLVCQYTEVGRTIVYSPILMKVDLKDGESGENVTGPPGADSFND